MSSYGESGTPERDWAGWSVLDGAPEMEFGDARRIVVFAPHPDDETLGLGGALHAFAQRRCHVTVVGVTDGEASHPCSRTISRPALAELRALERARALARLGLAHAEVVRLRRPDGGVIASRELISVFADCLHGSDICLAPFRHDGHPDHDATGAAAAAAAALTDVAFAEYLVWTWHSERPGAEGVPWHRARRISLSLEAKRAKAAAIEAYVSQIAPLSDRPGDEAVLSPPMLAHFQRDFEIVLAS